MPGLVAVKATTMLPDVMVVPLEMRTFALKAWPVRVRPEPAVYPVAEEKLVNVRALVPTTSFGGSVVQTHAVSALAVPSSTKTATSPACTPAARSVVRAHAPAAVTYMPFWVVVVCPVRRMRLALVVMPSTVCSPERVRLVVATTRTGFFHVTPLTLLST